MLVFLITVLAILIGMSEGVIRIMFLVGETCFVSAFAIRLQEKMK